MTDVVAETAVLFLGTSNLLLAWAVTRSKLPAPVRKQPQPADDTKPAPAPAAPPASASSNPGLSAFASSRPRGERGRFTRLDGSTSNA